MVIRNSGSPGFSIEPVGERIAQGEDAAAWARARFENSDVVTCPS